MKNKALAFARAIRWRELLLDNAAWFAGCVLFSAGIIIFAVPNDIAQSGITGAAIMVNYLIHTPIGLTNLVLNIPLIIAAWIVLGKRFVAKTLWTTVMLSVCLDAMEYLLPASLRYSGDKLLASLFCGAITGAGLALVFMRGATTGGTDILARLVKHRFPHISIGRVILVADAVIVFAAAVVFKSKESALYAAIVIFVSSRVIDYLLYGAGSGKMLFIVTEKAGEITRSVITDMKRGITVLPAVGGYSGESKNMLVCAVRSSEVAELHKIIRQHDDNAFVVVSEAGEILGEGFSPTPA